MCSFEPEWPASGEITNDRFVMFRAARATAPERGGDSRKGKHHSNGGFEAERTEEWMIGNVGNLGLLLFEVIGVDPYQKLLSNLSTTRNCEVKGFHHLCQLKYRKNYITLVLQTEVLSKTNYKGKLENHLIIGFGNTYVN